MKKSLIIMFITLLLTGCSVKQPNTKPNTKPNISTTKPNVVTTQKPTKPIKNESNYKQRDYKNMTATQLYEEGEKYEKQNNSIQAIESYYEASNKGNVKAKEKLNQFKVNSKEYKELKIK